MPPKISEAANFVKWLNDPEITRYISSLGEISLAAEKEYLKKMKSEPSKIMWSIYTKAGKHIGSTDLHNLSMQHKRTSWGIMIGDKSEWNKGYGADTLNIVKAYAFDKLGLNRFELEVFHKNAAGIKCYGKCGMKKEGIKRKYFIKPEATYDSIMMSMLRSEYQKSK